MTELGQVEPQFGLFDVTGGSTTTFVNTNFGNFENPPEIDVFKNYLAIVVRDAGGAGASPEGQWGVCSAYVDSTYTGTIATLGAAITSGDTIMLAKQDRFPLSQIIWSINKGLQSLGDLPDNPYETITAVSGTEEYDIPVSIKRGLKRVYVDDSGTWREIGFRVELTGAGTESMLYIPEDTSGTLRLVYDGEHANLKDFDDTINEYVHPEIVVKSAILKLLEWYNRQDTNQDSQSYHLWLEGQYRERHLPFALSKYPIKRISKAVRYFNVGR